MTRGEEPSWSFPCCTSLARVAKRKRRPTLLLGIAVLSVAMLASGSALAQTATVDFESLPVGTQFGGSPAPLSDSPGDLVFTEDGVGVRLETFTLGAFNGFRNVTFGGFASDPFPTTGATINNVRLDFDLTGLPGPVTAASFEFADFGGTHNLVINGTALELAAFTDAPAVVAGVGVMVGNAPMSGGAQGTVSLTGPITGLAIGGQELGIDNVSFVFVPEPASVAAVAVAVALIATRRSRAVRFPARRRRA